MQLSLQLAYRGFVTRINCFRARKEDAGVTCVQLGGYTINTLREAVAGGERENS